MNDLRFTFYNPPLFQDKFESKRSKQINMCFYLANFVMPTIFVIFAMAYFAVGLVNTVIG